MIKLGTQNISALHLGGQEIKKAYLGETLVLGAEKKPSRLPEGYTEVEYIQSSGGAYIKTGISPYSFYTMDMDVEILETTSTYSRYAFYAYYQKTTTNRYFCHLYVKTGDGFMGLLGNYSSAPNYKVSSDSTPRRTSISIDRLAKQFSVGGSKYTYPNGTMISAVPGIDLLNSSGAPATRGLDAKLYSVKFEKNGTSVADLVPCINPSGAVGLYDLVGAKFYGNAGTGTLTAGPEA